MCSGKQKAGVKWRKVGDLFPKLQAGRDSGSAADGSVLFSQMPLKEQTEEVILCPVQSKHRGDPLSILNRSNLLFLSKLPCLPPCKHLKAWSLLPNVSGRTPVSRLPSAVQMFLGSRPLC